MKNKKIKIIQATPYWLKPGNPIQIPNIQLAMPKLKTAICDQNSTIQLQTPQLKIFNY